MNVGEPPGPGGVGIQVGLDCGTRKLDVRVWITQWALLGLYAISRGGPVLLTIRYYGSSNLHIDDIFDHGHFSDTYKVRTYRSGLSPVGS